MPTMRAHHNSRPCAGGLINLWRCQRRSTERFTSVRSVRDFGKFIKLARSPFLPHLAFPLQRRREKFSSVIANLLSPRNSDGFKNFRREHGNTSKVRCIAERLVSIILVYLAIYPGTAWERSVNHVTIHEPRLGNARFVHVSDNNGETKERKQRATALFPCYSVKLAFYFDEPLGIS